MADVTAAADAAATDPHRAPAAASGPAALSHREIMVVLGGLMAGMFLAALDQTIVATALPTIVGDLGGIEQLSWVVTAYLLTSTAATPLFGKISDLYGRRALFRAAILVFLLGSLLAGVAQTMTQLVAFRAVQGVGAGGLIALTQAIIGDVVAPRERGRYQGYIGAVFAASSLIGPFLGGFLVDALSWRWVFTVNLPVGAVALLVTSRALRKLPQRRVDRAIDYVGAALLVAAVSSLMLALVWGGEVHPWSSPTIVALLAGAGVLAALFLVQERRAAEPILPLRLFASRTFAAASGASVLIGMTMFSAFIFMPVYLQIVVGTSATVSGLLLLPLMAGLLTSTIVSGRRISATGRSKRYPVVGTLLLAIGLGLLALLDAGSSAFQASASLVVVGAGLGMVLQNLILIVQNDVDPRDLGIATSSIAFFRSLGGTLGTAVFGAILTNRLTAWLDALVPAAARATVDPASLRGSPEVIASLPPDVRAGVVEAFANAVGTVFLVGLPVAVGAFVLVLLLEERPLRGRDDAAFAAFAEEAALPAAPVPTQAADAAARPAAPARP